MKRIADPRRKNELEDAYFAYFRAYSQRNWEAMVENFSAGMTMFGTGVDEVAFDQKTTLSVLRREFEQSPVPIHFKVTRLEAFDVCPDIAMLMITMNVTLHARNQPLEFLHNRTTALMSMEAGRWKLVHAHWSQPDKDIAEGESVPYRLLMERSRELERKIEARTEKIASQKEHLLQLNQVKDKLFSVIAHDLKNPFNCIMGFSGLLENNLEDYEQGKVKQMLGAIHAQSRSAHELLENLMEWAKSQTDQISCHKTELNLKTLMDKCIEHSMFRAREKSISFHLGDGCDQQITADRHMLQIILRNLLSNAVKFSHPGGKVSLNARANHHKVFIEVSDEGVGMDKERLAFLEMGLPTESFTGTALEKGTGLGLMLCREFILRQKGEFQIESTPGQGSCFRVLLPLNGG